MPNKNAPTLDALPERQRELLPEMLEGKYDERGCWYAPLDLGGRNGSHHAQTLRALWMKGLVERVKYGCYCKHEGGRECRCKGSCRYRLSDAGRAVLRVAGIQS